MPGSIKSPATLLPITTGGKGKLLKQQVEEIEDLAEEVTPAEVQAEVASWLQPMMTELPEKYRQALLLTDIQGLTQQQLADQLDLSLSGAKSRIQRAREKLKDVLLGCCHLEFDRLGRVRKYQFKEPSCRFCGEEANS